MKKNQLIFIFRSFSKKEIREFRKWLHSPIHNQRQDVIQLFEFLFENGHLHKEESLDKPNVFSWIFPKETYDDAKMRQVIFFLMQTVEQFLAYQEFSKDQIKTKTALAKSYRKRILDKSFEKTFKSVQKIQEAKGIENEVFYRNNYALELERYAYLSKVNRLSFNLQEISDSMDVAFIAGKLRQSCLMLTHQTVYKKEYSIKLLNEILEFVEKENYLDIPVIAVYFFTYKTITEKENENHYQNLKKQIIENGQLFPLSEIRDIYLMAINYCIGRMNSGVKPYIREAFELYKLGFEKKILIENNLITRVTFHNIISIGLKLKEYEWVESFIFDYQQYLEEKHRVGFVYYSLARTHYEKREYEQAMQLLVQEAHYDDILIGLTAKTLLSRMYYEENEYDALESLLESMRIYLQRKKVMSYHKANFKNYIRYMKKLLKIQPSNKSAIEKLKTEISNADPLTNDERNWLLIQVENLK